MIQDISTNEFVSGIANGLYDENDIVKYCSTLGNVKAFWGALIVEHSRMIGMSNAPIVSFSTDAVLTTNDDTISPENALKIDRLAKAICIVEELKQGERKQATSNEHSEIPQATDDEIIKLLYDLYDILSHDSVIDGLERLEFINNIATGEVAPIDSKHSGWVKKTAKFKAFITVIRPFFNEAWYLAVCRNAGLTKDQMCKYDSQGDSTKIFEKNLKKTVQKKN